MKEHSPLVQGVVQDALQFGGILYRAETTRGIGMLEWVGTGCWSRGFARLIPTTASL